MRISLMVILKTNFTTNIVTRDGGPRLGNVADPPDNTENLRNPVVSRTYGPFHIC